MSELRLPDELLTKLAVMNLVEIKENVHFIASSAQIFVHSLLLSNHINKEAFNQYMRFIDSKKEEALQRISDKEKEAQQPLPRPFEPLDLETVATVEYFCLTRYPVSSKEFEDKPDFIIKHNLGHEFDVWEAAIRSAIIFAASKTKET